MAVTSASERGVFRPAPGVVLHGNAQWYIALGSRSSQACSRLFSDLLVTGAMTTQT